MIYLKIKPGTWLKFDEVSETGKVLLRRKLLSRQVEIEARLAELPGFPTDEELLAWARVHYPALNTTRERDLLVAELEIINIDLEGIREA